MIFTVDLDGRAYRPFYGYSDDEAMPYGANLHRQIDLLGARGQLQMAEASEILNERATHTAFEYAVLMTKLRELDVLGRAFPHAIRGTVHPKPGQYPPKIKDGRTLISPWHGVALVGADGRVVTEYETSVYEEFEKYTAVYIAGDEAPFYYESHETIAQP